MACKTLKSAYIRITCIHVRFNVLRTEFIRAIIILKCENNLNNKRRRLSIMYYFTLTTRTAWIFKRRMYTGFRVFKISKQLSFVSKSSHGRVRNMVFSCKTMFSRMCFQSMCPTRAMDASQTIIIIEARRWVVWL